VPSGSTWRYVQPRPSPGAREKSLVLATERLAGRSSPTAGFCATRFIWAKSTRCRPASAPVELHPRDLYFFVREHYYFFDLDAIRIPHTSSLSRPAQRPQCGRFRSWRGPTDRQPHRPRSSQGSRTRRPSLARIPGCLAPLRRRVIAVRIHPCSLRADRAAAACDLSGEVCSRAASPGQGVPSEGRASRSGR